MHALQENSMQDTFDDLIRPILQPNQGDSLQVLYVRLSNGMLVPFIGAPMPPEEWEQVEAIAQGETVLIDYVDYYDGDYDELDEFEAASPKRCYQ